MENASRKELIKQVDAQSEKLAKYEKKLRDVVKAYKILQQEKETLASSLSALTSSTTTTATDGRVSAQSGAEEDDAASSQNKDGDSSPREQGDGGADDSKLREQVVTLTQALSTITAQKTSMETNFQQDRKSLVAEKDKFEGMLLDERESWDLKSAELLSTIDSLKLQLKNQQQERDREHGDHAIMIRELQKTISNERSYREKLENEIEETREKLANYVIQSSKEEGEFDKRIAELQAELKATKAKLRDAEAELKNPSPVIVQLEGKIEEMKERHRNAIMKEEKKLKEAEKRGRLIADASEERVANLESKLAELSDTMGTYDKMRQQDQATITKLKDNITQLDMENTALAKVATIFDGSSNLEDESNWDVNRLLEQMHRLKGLLKLANQRSEKPLNIENALMDLKIDKVVKPDHKACEQELEQLREDFNSYKKWTHTLLSARGRIGSITGEEHQDHELAVMKHQINDFKKKVENLDSIIASMKASHQEEIDNYKKAANEEQMKHRQEIKQKDSEYSYRVGELEEALEKQRGRSLKLLEDKDLEISQLKDQVDDLQKRISRLHESKAEDEDVSDGLRAETQMLHFSSELARRDIEVQNLRKSKHQLESALRDLQCCTSMKEEKYSDRINDLEGHVDRLERSRRREGINLEYVKNVLMSYLLSTDKNRQQHMLNAIITCLLFNPEEAVAVKQAHAQSWLWKKAPNT